jgi:hypothetical protein
MTQTTTKVEGGKDKPTLPHILREVDMLQKALSSKEGDGELFKSFKERIKSTMSSLAGSAAYAIEACENPKFLKVIKEICAGREKRGYKGAFDIECFDPLQILRAICPYKDWPKDIYYTSDLMERVFLEYGVFGTRDPTQINYSDLKKAAEQNPKIKEEVSALRHIMENQKYVEGFKRRLTLLTAHLDYESKEAAAFIGEFLRITSEKKLYDGKFRMLDVGTGSGRFTSPFVSFVRDKKNFERSEIVRTDVVEFPLLEHRDLKVKIHDMSEGPIEGEGKFNSVVMLNVTKLYQKKSRGKIWNNVIQDVAEGGLVAVGSTGKEGSAFKPHIKHNGVLVKVDGDKYLSDYRNTENYQDYLRNLDAILARSQHIEKK